MTQEKPLLLTISVTEDEIRGIGGENIVGAYASMKYFQSMDNPENKSFVAAFKKRWGNDMVIGDVTPGGLSWPMVMESGG